MDHPEGVVPVLRVVTEAIDDIHPLVPLVDPRHPLVFIQRGQGIAGIGEALRLEFSGPTRMTDAAAAWKRVAAAAEVTDPLVRPGTGLVALGAFAFAETAASTLSCASPVAAPAPAPATATSPVADPAATDAGRDPISDWALPG